MRAHLLVVGATAVALVAVVVLAVVVLPFGGNDDEPDEDDDVAGFGGTLPASDPLPRSQLLVAAGPTSKRMRLWLVDTSSPGRSHEVTLGTRNEWLPVLAPGRDTVIYSRLELNSTTDYQLRVAAAGTGEEPRALFDAPPQVCSRHSGRPAWGQPAGPESRFIVMRCVDDDDNELRLVMVDAQGDVTVLDVLDQDGQPWPRFGDPTVSPDGKLVLLWVTDDTSAEAGSLYAIDLEDGTSHAVLEQERDRQFSDPVFAPVDDRYEIAYRNAVDGTGFDIWTTTIDDFEAVDPHPLVSTPAADEDPTYSPDGTQIAFTSTAGGQATLMLVDVAPGSAPVPVDVPPEFPAMVKVPAWSTR